MFRSFFVKNSLILFVFGAILISCSKEPSFVRSIKGNAPPFNIEIMDINEDQKPDMFAIDHGKGTVTTYLQKDDLRFEQGIESKIVGFHPGDLLPWDAANKIILLAAEGSNELRSLDFNNPQNVSIKSRAPSKSPRYLSRFNWPNWGDSVVATVFQDDSLILYGHLDAKDLGKSEVYTLPLSNNRPSIRSSKRFTIADIDADGIDEILFVSAISKELMVVRYHERKDEIKAEVLLRKEEWAMPSSVSAIDLDDDGDKDLLIADEVDPALIHMLENKGHGEFEERGVQEFPYQTTMKGMQQLAVGIEQSGQKTIIAVGSGGLVAYKIDPSQAYKPWLLVGIKMENDEANNDMKLVDLNLDGHLDLVLGRSASHANITIIDGPLWDNLSKLASDDYVLLSRKN